MRTVYSCFIKYVKENDLGKTTTLWKTISDQTKVELKTILSKNPDILEIDLFKDVIPLMPIEEELKKEEPLIKTKDQYPKRGRKVVSH